MKDKQHKICNRNKQRYTIKLKKEHNNSHQGGDSSLKTDKCLDQDDESYNSEDSEEAHSMT
eukprot:14114033-Ditylum_brightwellii.AAC.1